MNKTSIVGAYGISIRKSVKTNKTSNDVKCNAFGISIGKSDIHMRTYRGRWLHYLCTWTIRNFSSIQKETASSRGFYLHSGFGCGVQVAVNQEEVEIKLIYDYKNQRCWREAFTILTDSGEPLFHKTLDEQQIRESKDTVSVTGEDFQKLKQLPNDTFVLTCRIMRSVDDILNNICISESINNLEYLQSLQADLKKYSSAFAKEKISLCVGQETETINKAILCTQSPVFAKMFETDMEEHRNNTVTISDIKMPELRVLVSFLCSGLLPDLGLILLCDLYKAAIKYEVWELHRACLKCMCNKMSQENVTRLLRLSKLNKDELLKSVAMTFVSANIEIVAITPKWKDLMCDDPEIALKAATFFDL